MDTKEAGKTVVKFGAGAAGLTAGALALRQVNKVLPANFPALAKQLTPGIATMLIAYLFSAKVKDDRLKAIAMGLGLSGFADLTLKTLGDKVKLIAEYVPALSGLGQPGYASVNQGSFPPSYYKENAFQGLGDAYALNGFRGVPVQGVPMNGDAYSLNGTPYALT